MSNDPGRSDASQISTDRESIRAWADEHEATPFRHREEEAYRLAGEDRAGEAHEPADWDEFHSHLEENEQVVIYHGETADEPFEVAHREEAIGRSNVSNEELEQRLVEGDTVTSTVTETAVVEEVIVEEATIESELVDTEVTDDRVIDAELLSRECTNCTLEDTGTVDAGEWFDTDRYLTSIDATGDTGPSGYKSPGTATERGETSEARTASTEPGGSETVRSESTTTGTTEAGTTDAGRMDEGTTGTSDTDRMDEEMAGTTDVDRMDEGTAGTEADATGTTATDRAYTAVDEEYPFTAHLDVEEAWSVTRELTERYTVESRVTDVDAAETASVEERDIDVEGLQRNLAESNIIDFDLSPEEMREEGEIETEFAEDDLIRTHFTRTRIVDDEVVDRAHLEAEVTGAAERTGFERISSMDVTSETTEGTGAMGAGPTDEEMMTDEGGTATDDGTMAGAGTTDEEVMEGSAAMETASGEEVETGGGAIPLSQNEVGKDVVDSSGETIGMVTDVSDDGTTMYVDAHPGITERIKAALDWGGAGDDDYPVEVEQIDQVTNDAIALKGAEELDELSSPAP